MGFFKSLKGDGPSHIGVDPGTQGYEPPPGPPPSRKQKADDTEDYTPPPVPPPSDNPPPYHDWTVVLDTALLPPPPVFSHGLGRSKNYATWDEAARAHAYCDQFPPYLPSQPSAAVYEAVQGGHSVLEKPREFAGELRQMDKMWRARTRRGCGDCVLISSLVRVFQDCFALLLIQLPTATLFRSCRLSLAHRAQEDRLFRGQRYGHGVRSEE